MEGIGPVGKDVEELRVKVAIAVPFEPRWNNLIGSKDFYLTVKTGIWP